MRKYKKLTREQRKWVEIEKTYQKGIERIYKITLDNSEIIGKKYGISGRTVRAINSGAAAARKRKC